VDLQSQIREDQVVLIITKEGAISMRIQSFSQIQQLYGTKKSTRTSPTATVSRKDELEISSIGKDFQTAKKAVSEASDIREDVVAPIKARVQNGTYEVSGESFADKLLAQYNA